LIDDCVIELDVRATDVLITLCAGNSWREVGDAIRRALQDALADPTRWLVDAPTDSGATLMRAATELLGGQIGALAKSHGGTIELVSVVGNNVTVRMSGACSGCPSSASTLYERLRRELRRRVGNEVTVTAENGLTSLSFGKKLLSLLIR
jgi:Fe-S cluster biogenesis protein NfuA